MHSEKLPENQINSWLRAACAECDWPLAFHKPDCPEINQKEILNELQPLQAGDIEDLYERFRNL